RCSTRFIEGTSTRSLSSRPRSLLTEFMGYGMVKPVDNVLRTIVCSAGRGALAHVGNGLSAKTAKYFLNRRSWKILLLGALGACGVPSLGAAPAAGRMSASDDVPAWLRQAAAVNLPPYDKKVRAVVLLDERRVTVDDEGRVAAVRNYAVKLLTREGREDAIAAVGYNTDSEK